MPEKEKEKLPFATIIVAIGIGLVLVALVLTYRRFSREKQTLEASGPDEWIARLEESVPTLNRVQRRRLRRALSSAGYEGRSRRSSQVFTDEEPASPASPASTETPTPDPGARYRFKEEVPHGPGVLAAQPERVESAVDIGFDDGASGELGASVISSEPIRPFIGIPSHGQAPPIRPNFGGGQ